MILLRHIILDSHDYHQDPENIKALLATQFNDFSLGRRYDFFKPLLGKGFSHWMVKDGNIVDQC